MKDTTGEMKAQGVKKLVKMNKGDSLYFDFFYKSRQKRQSRDDQHVKTLYR